MNRSQLLKTFVKKIIASAGTALGVYQSRFRHRSLSGKSLILMYHRIVSPELTSRYVEPGMYVRPETFALHCQLLKRYFDVVPLSELFGSDSQESSKPRCAITFDDGWVDFLENAFPILKANNLHSTVYLPTNYIGTPNIFWTDRCSEILKLLFTKITLPEYRGSNTLVRKIFELKGDFTIIVDTVIKMLKPLQLVEINDILTEISTCCGNSEPNDRVFLSWDEVRYLKKSNLVCFGSHTANHLILTTESDQVIIEELKRSKEKLIDEKVAGHDMILFCYPNGGYTSHIASLVKDAGYLNAVTTTDGWNSDKSDSFSLKRVGMHQDMTSNNALIMARLATNLE